MPLSLIYDLAISDRVLTLFFIFANLVWLVPSLGHLMPFSTFQYSYESLVRVELLNNRVFSCEGPDAAFSEECENESDQVTAQEVLEKNNLENAISIPLGITILVGWIVAARILGYLALKLVHASHKPKRSSWRQ